MSVRHEAVVILLLILAAHGGLPELAAAQEMPPPRPRATQPPEPARPAPAPAPKPKPQTATPRPRPRADGDAGTAPVPSAAGDMVLVPAGTFLMGCNEAVDRECFDNEKPARRVQVDAFRIDRTEVTVADYQRCVEAGGCSADGITMPLWMGKEQPDQAARCNWGSSGREQHPMNCVAWEQAWAYCTWARKRLPTGAQWEKAARGTEGRKYPWGNSGYEPGSRVANITGSDDGYVGTAPVGSFSAGASPYGALGMVGNVFEWVSDEVVSSGDGRGLRGGSWRDEPRYARASYRNWLAPRSRGVNVGFRCAQ